MRPAWLALAAAAVLAGCAPHRVVGPISTAEEFQSLPGWTGAHMAAAVPALQAGCARLALSPPDQMLGGNGVTSSRAGDWTGVCAAVRALPPGDEAAARAFVQARFTLQRLTDAARPDGLFTGYYEPEVPGSREQTRRFSVPVLSRPADLVEHTDAAGRQVGRKQDGVLVPYWTRAEIDAGALRRQRLDLVYLQSPIDLFFMQIQGSGRVDLPGGQVVRLGYAGNNGQPYQPIGRVLSERGDMAEAAVTAQSIRAWLLDHPQQARATMELNPSYTFFREQPDLAPSDGPLGTLGVALTPGRSVAADRGRVPLGAPLWIDTTAPDGSKLQRLMLIQDTGSAVVGALRADIFYGWGAGAEDQAGRMHAGGQAWLLLPKPAPRF